MVTGAEEEVLELGSRDPLVGLETEQVLIGRLQTTLRGMEDLVLEMVKGSIKDPGIEMKNSVLNGAVEMKKPVLIAGGLNIPRHLVTIL